MPAEPDSPDCQICQTFQICRIRQTCRTCQTDLPDLPENPSRRRPPFSDQVGAIVDVLARSVPSGGRAVVLIDGRSGSGKSTLATLLAPRLGAQLVRLDDLYPGWSGLAEASRMVVDDVLLGGEWTGWDWENERHAERHVVDASMPLIIEGCGSISRRSSHFATSSIWVELDAATRRRNALLRDGAAFEPFWDMWALQEDELIRREDPRHRAQMVVRGSDFSLIR